MWPGINLEKSSRRTHYAQHHEGAGQALPDLHQPGITIEPCGFVHSYKFNRHPAQVSAPVWVIMEYYIL